MNCSKDYWEKFYSQYFSLSVDFSDLKLPKFNQEEYCLLIILAGISLDDVFSAFERKLKMKIENYPVSNKKHFSIREPKENYFVLVPKMFNICFLGKNSSRGINHHRQITLIEALICFMSEHDSRNRKMFLLDSVFVCGGTKVEKGRETFLPAVCYYKEVQSVHIIWYESFFAISNVDMLEVCN